jgi:Activator of Hsp90 ATPase homolog 1-like protein
MNELVVRRTLHTDLCPAALMREVLELDWLGDEVEVDLRPGGRGSLVDDDGVARRLVIDEVDEQEICFRWWPEQAGPVSHVRLTVTPEGEGARLTVTEVAPAAHLDASAKGRRWEARLEALADRCGALLRV